MRTRALITILAAALLAPSSAHAGASPGAPLDGPSPDILSLGGVAVSRDGSGGLAYLKRDAGVAHVFAAALENGVFGAPQRVDAGLPGPADQPVIAAGNNGRVAVAFLEGAALYVAVRPALGQPFGAPQPLASLAANPALGMSIHGAAYIAFTVPGKPAQVRVAHMGLKASSFTLVDGVLNMDPSRNAGDSAPKRPVVGASADGTALVAWGEDGSDGHVHVYSRRTVRDGLSSVVEDLNVASLDGRPGGDADSPDIRMLDNGSLGWVTFRQSFADGAGTVSRAIGRHLIGSMFDPPAALDGLTFPTAEGADAPRIDIRGVGDGLAVTGLHNSHQVLGSVLQSDQFVPVQRLDSATNAIAPLPVVAFAQNRQAVVAWQQSSGGSDTAVLHGRLLDNGTLGPEVALSRPELGAVDATLGLAAQADKLGDTVVGFVQGDAVARRISVAVISAPPTRFAITDSSRFTRQTRPTLSWEDSIGGFGAISYRVTLDGHLLGVTAATHLRVPAPLAEGLHLLSVAAVDPRGQSTTATAGVVVDNTPPTVRIAARGRSAVVTVTDPAPRSTTARPRGSGVGRVLISFGDGSHASAPGPHRYSRAGSFTVTVVATDRAGNARRAHRTLHVR